MKRLQQTYYIEKEKKNADYDDDGDGDEIRMATRFIKIILVLSDCVAQHFYVIGIRINEINNEKVLNCHKKRTLAAKIASKRRLIKPKDA